MAKNSIATKEEAKKCLEKGFSNLNGDELHYLFLTKDPTGIKRPDQYFYLTKSPMATAEKFKSLFDDLWAIIQNYMKENPEQKYIYSMDNYANQKHS